MPNCVISLPADVVVVEVAADAQLLDLELAGAAALGAADQGVVLRVVEVVDVAGVDPELAGEDLRVERRLGCAGVAVEPGEVGERERVRRVWRSGFGCPGLRGRGVALCVGDGTALRRGRCRRPRSRQGLRIGQRRAARAPRSSGGTNPPETGAPAAGTAAKGTPDGAGEAVGTGVLAGVTAATLFSRVASRRSRSRICSRSCRSLSVRGAGVGVCSFAAASPCFASAGRCSGPPALYCAEAVHARHSSRAAATASVVTNLSRMFIVPSSAFARTRRAAGRGAKRQAPPRHPPSGRLGRRNERDRIRPPGGSRPHKSPGRRCQGRVNALALRDGRRPIFGGVEGCRRG